MLTYTKNLIILLSVLFGLYFIDISFFNAFINKEQSILVISILENILNNKITGTDIWINNSYKIIIDYSCNGLITYLLLLSTVLAYKFKPIYILIVYIYIFLLNILRLYIVVKIVNLDQNYFFIVHDIFGNLLLGGMSLLFFYVVLKAEQNSQLI